LLDLSCDSKEDDRERLQVSRRLQLSFEENSEGDATEALQLAQQILGDSPRTTTSLGKAQEYQSEAFNKKFPPSYSKPPLNTVERAETNHKSSVSCDPPLIDSSPESSSWFKINTKLRQLGFCPIVIEHDENMKSAPDISSLAETLLDVLDNYERKSHKLQEHVNTQRLPQELSHYKREIEALTAENSRLKQEQEKDRQRTRDDNSRTNQQFTEYHTSIRTLKAKLDSASQLIAQRDEQISELKAQLSKTCEVPKSTDCENEVFRRFFNREYRPSSGQDAKIMGLIVAYEHQRQLKAPEAAHDTRLEQAHQELELKFKEALGQIDRFRRERIQAEGQRHAIDQEASQLRAELRERPTVREVKVLQEQVRLLETLVSSGKDQTSTGEVSTISGEQAKKFVLSFAEGLSIKHARDLLPSFDKMQRVVRAVPKLEHFIKRICAEVFPNDPDFGIAKMSEVLPSVKRWRSQLEDLASLKAFKAQVCRLAGLGETSNASGIDIVSPKLSF
jgi:hypothetical protein